MLLTYAIERLQAFLPLNPQGLAAVGPIWPGTRPPALPPIPTGSRISPRNHHELFHRNGRSATHNFFSAAVGIVVAVALIRGIKRTTSGTIGNFWVDTTAPCSMCSCRARSSMHCCWWRRA